VYNYVCLAKYVLYGSSWLFFSHIIFECATTTTTDAYCGIVEPHGKILLWKRNVLAEAASPRTGLNVLEDGERKSYQILSLHLGFAVEWLIAAIRSKHPIHPGPIVALNKTTIPSQSNELKLLLAKYETCGAMFFGKMKSDVHVATRVLPLTPLYLKYLSPIA